MTVFSLSPIAQHSTAQHTYLLELVGPESVVLCVGLMTIGYGHAPYREHAVHIVPHPGIVLGPAWSAIFVQESWEETCYRVLRTQGSEGGLS